MNLREEIEKYFRVYSEERVGETMRFYVMPVASDVEIRGFLQMLSQEYEISLRYYYGEMVLELRKTVVRENYIVNVLLLIATFVTTTLVGSTFYGKEIDILGGVMFSLAIMFVLGSHEMGHYFAARRWRMKTSLPYFIPFPTIIGTLGAVIRHRGAIPNRKALFDVGVAGPITGIVASIIVVVIGLQLPFELRAEPTLYIGTPPIFDAMLYVLHYNKEAIHPVAFAGWVGFFVTFLNMLPVGQLDGGHVMRAMVGEMSETISKFMPVILIGYGLYVMRALNQPNTIWVFWGVITFFFSMQRHPKPIDDETPIGLERYVVGLFAFILALLCFTPVPFYY
ncbi:MULTISPECIES: site-2 protease family protein [unclassified Archaeoglobus]|jgi:membrane-associated protease RseP (regulator of RpoE activity)|uniref:site-2 protease family protein n=1 Tax=unclassified Archaeoglobus TaxID=2643606 RepID=UPI0025C378E7|nr:MULTISPECIES: site-2 protease family protein [unclassified Archaeoglobus]